MVDKKVLMAEVRKLKEKINRDPKVKALYDLNGDGHISGEEWELARRALVKNLEAQEARAKIDPERLKALDQQGLLAAGGEQGAAQRVFSHIANRDTQLPAGHPLLHAELIISQMEKPLEIWTGRETLHFDRRCFIPPIGAGSEFARGEDPEDQSGRQHTIG